MAVRQIVGKASGVCVVVPLLVEGLLDVFWGKTGVAVLESEEITVTMKV
jgi:hypothetical protein